jgi:hypothetical protein
MIYSLSTSCLDKISSIQVSISLQFLPAIGYNKVEAKLSPNKEDLVEIKTHSVLDFLPHTGIFLLQYQVYFP